jgi:ubiquitin-conjugating enzyme E2 M
MEGLGAGIRLTFPDANDLFSFHVTIAPDDGMYRGGVFPFTFRVSQDYPHQPPKVLCTRRVYHPNLDLEGNVCLNILREEWKPVLNIHAVLLGLQFLFMEPNADDPLNKEAAAALRADRRAFAGAVQRTMRGGSVGGVAFDVVVPSSSSS